MRPENEWFKPEALKAYFFLYEALALLTLVVVGALLSFVGAFSEAPFWVVALVVAAPLTTLAFLTWWIPAFYRSAEYRLGDDELEYRRGVFFRQRTTVPYDRITNVDATQGPLQRLVGAGSVGVHTAGYGGQVGAELSISGVGDYEEIKDQVLGKVRRRRPTATESGDGVESVPTDGRRSDVDGDQYLVELRRIRELLEREHERGGRA